MRNDVRNRLMEIARHRGLVKYGELMEEFHLARGRHIALVLCEISEYEHANGRPFLSAIVVRADTVMPSPDFWGLNGISRDLSWTYYKNEVHDYWWNQKQADLERLRRPQNDNFPL